MAARACEKKYTRYEKGSYKENLVRRHLPQVNREADRLAMALPAHVEKSDLVGSGFVGLMEAIENYDPCRGVAFEAYARQRIRGAMLDELRRLSWAPRSFFRRLRELELAKKDLSDTFGREPEISELAAKLSLPEAVLQQFLSEVNQSALVSIEELLFSGAEKKIARGAQERADERPEAGLLHKERKEMLAKGIAKLPEKKQFILSLYYVEKLTLKEIAAILDLSAPRISQLHADALLQLRRYFEEEDFCE